MRRLKTLFLIACLAAAALPAWVRESTASARSISGAVAAWPMQWDGRPLTPLPLTDEEQLYFSAVPMQMARFTDGTREILFRRIERGTRLLHSSAFCLRGAGFAVTQPTLFEDHAGRRWSRFSARREEKTVVISERIEDSSGQAWTDVSAWYWAAMLERTAGPWTAVTLQERSEASQSSQQAP